MFKSCLGNFRRIYKHLETSAFTILTKIEKNYIIISAYNSICNVLYKLFSMEKQMSKKLTPYQVAKICKREGISLKEFYKRNFEENFGEDPEEKNKEKEKNEEIMMKNFEKIFC